MSFGLGVVVVVVVKAEEKIWSAEAGCCLREMGNFEKSLKGVKQG
jgi:hypothetical protein